MRNNILTTLILIVVLCFSAFLLFAKLGERYLWQDEAETALVSKTILSYGIPHGYDGRNYFSQLRGHDCTKSYVWCRHTWLPFYILAGFFKLFGYSTFVCRLPFALFGLATIVLTYVFTETLWPGRRISIITIVLLAASVPFLLLARQCRYYSLAMFFSILSFYAYILFLNHKKYSGIFLFAAATLLFHSQHIYILILLPAIFIHTIIFHRYRLKTLLIIISAILLFNSPWLIWIASGEQKIINSPSAVYNGCITLLSNINRNVFPFGIMLTAIVIIAAVRFLKSGSLFRIDISLLEKITLPVLFIVFNLVVVAVLTPFPFFRYMSPSLIFMIILMAVIIIYAGRMHWLFACAIIIFILYTGKLADFFYEITHDFNRPTENICRYLNDHGSPDDVVLVTYSDMPLKFYTKMRVIGGLTGENLEPAQNAKWIIIRHCIVSAYEGEVRKYILNCINPKNYRKIELDCPDSIWENREEVDAHLFRQCLQERNVIIYERIG